MEWEHPGGFVADDSVERLDLDVVHGFLGRFVVATLLAHPELQELRRTLPATADAHDLYRSYGFADLEDPSRYLAIRRDPAVLYRQA